MRRPSALSVDNVRAVAISYAPLLVVLAAGLLLRVYLMAVYSPIAASFNDSVQYLATSEDHLFRDPFRPPGYPLFLRILRYTFSELSFVVVVQHLLGLLTGAFLYFCVRHVTGRRWLPALPAAIVVLSGDQLLLEHSLLTEALYTFLATAAVCAVVIGTTSARAAPLLVAGGVALGCATTVRSVAIPIIGLVGVWMLWAAAGSLRSRLKKVGWAVGPAVAIFVSFIVFQGTLAGVWGVSEAAGWALYTRVAPIADCTEFDPPDGTKFLCETKPSFSETPGAGRAGPGYYQYVGGPSIDRYGNPFEAGLRGTSTLEEFAFAVLVHQPLDYAREVGRDMVRYIVQDAGYDRAYAGAGADELDIARRVPSIEELTIAQAEAAGFEADAVDVDGGVHALQDFQRATRIQGIALIVLLALAGTALVVGQGMVRRSALFLGAAAIGQAFVPVASISWGFRYGVPSLGPLAAAAALGIHASLERARQGGRLGGALPRARSKPVSRTPVA
jgi:dolichyl-phosphate-mannose-protein mannosyltransferase